MRVEEALATRLREDEALVDLIGTRIYPAKAPQGTSVAYVVYDLIGGEVVAAHDGFSGLRTGRISFTCCAPRYAEAKAVTEAVRSAIAGWRGQIGTLEVVVPRVYEDEDGWDDTLSLYVIVVDMELYWRG